MAVTPKHEHGNDFPIPFVTRKTPVLLLVRAFGAVFLLELLYVLLRLTASSFENVFNPASVWVFLIFTAVQLVAFFLLFLHWYYETYEVHKDDVHHNKGILFRDENPESTQTWRPSNRR